MSFLLNTCGPVFFIHVLVAALQSCKYFETFASKLTHSYGYLFHTNTRVVFQGVFGHLIKIVIVIVRSHTLAHGIFVINQISL